MWQRKRTKGVVPSSFLWVDLWEGKRPFQQLNVMRFPTTLLPNPVSALREVRHGFSRGQKKGQIGGKAHSLI